MLMLLVVAKVNIVPSENKNQIMWNIKVTFWMQVRDYARGAS